MRKSSRGCGVLRSHTTKASASAMPSPTVAAARAGWRISAAKPPSNAHNAATTSVRPIASNGRLRAPGDGRPAMTKRGASAMAARHSGTVTRKTARQPK
jgi:hypothetical protein